MYFSFIYKSDLIRWLLEIIHVHSKGSVSSEYRVEPESKNSNVNDILNWLSIVWNVTPSF